MITLCCRFMFIQYRPGIASMISYPYEEYEKHEVPFKCRFNQTMSIGSNEGYARISGNETVLRDAVAAFGPVAFVMNANLGSFTFYRQIFSLIEI